MTHKASIATVLLMLFVLSGCASTAPSCGSPQTRNLDAAVDTVEGALMAGCHAHLDRYFDDLLRIAEGDPKPENKQTFSEFLVWTTEQGLLSKRQAENYYNRHFNVKFMSMRGDYNNCSHTCPNKRKVLFDMERELADKERGLLKVSRDANAYYRADSLYQELELVLEATCSACNASR